MDKQSNKNISNRIIVPVLQFVNNPNSSLPLSVALVEQAEQDLQVHQVLMECQDQMDLLEVTDSLVRTLLPDKFQLLVISASTALPLRWDLRDLKALKDSQESQAYLDWMELLDFAVLQESQVLKDLQVRTELSENLVQLVLQDRLYPEIHLQAHQDQWDLLDNLECQALLENLE